MNFFKPILIATMSMALSLPVNSFATDLIVQTKKIGAAIQPTMYGLFFEDINFAADGGLYGELIKNRSFEFPQNLQGWKSYGDVKISTVNPPFNRNPHYVILNPANHAHKISGIENEGFFGIGLKENNDYRFSVWASTLDRTAILRIEFIDENNGVANQIDISVNGSEWQKYETIIKSSKTINKGKIRVNLISQSGVKIDHVSLFPVDTYKGEKNGLRKDLAQDLEDIHPGVFRFPGGCIVEGTDINTRYNWKNSIGPVENRPLNENRWNYTFKDRLYPDYYQTYGLGFYEYFLLSEHIGAEPLPILNCGLACQYQNNDTAAHIPVNKLDSYIQDALDLIEFANGDSTTTWGSVRCKMGHQAPFNLKYVGIGNEQWGKEYVERLELFVKAINKKYPKVKIVGGAGPNSEGKEFDYLWPEMKRLKVNLVDEHFYRGEDWFLSQAKRYDNYDRKGPKVFAGEYACHPKNRKNNFMAALCEASFMTGLERNADVVYMATYAPLFAHIDGWQWRPDLIWFDNINSVKSINYYVQQMYGNNPGTNVLQLTMNGAEVAGQKGLYASAVIDKNSDTYIVKIVNTSGERQDINLILNGISRGKILYGTKSELTSNDMDSENTLDNPEAVTPVVSDLTMKGDTNLISLPARSFTMYKISLPKRK